MSRGPGRWQREILAALDQVDAFYLVDLLPRVYTRAEYNAAHRAAFRLRETQRVDMWHFAFGTPKVMVCCPGSGKPERPAGSIMGIGMRRRAMCWCGANLGTHQHIAVSVDTGADLPPVQQLDAIAVAVDR